MKAMGFPVLVRLTQIIDSVEYDDAPWSPAKWHSKHPRNLGMPHPNSTTKYYKYSMTKLWWRQAPLPGNQTWQWKSYEITYLEMIFTDFPIHISFTGISRQAMFEYRSDPISTGSSCQLLQWNTPHLAWSFRTLEYPARCEETREYPAGRSPSGKSFFGWAIESSYLVDL